MITSRELLLFGRSNNPCFLSAIMSARDYTAIVNKCIYSDPNYGSCWFRAKLFPLGSAQEVAFRAIKFTAHEVAITSNVYYDAMLQFAYKLKREERRLDASEVDESRGLFLLFPTLPNDDQSQVSHDGKEAEDLVRNESDRGLIMYTNHIRIHHVCSNYSIPWQNKPPFPMSPLRPLLLDAS